FTGRSLVSKLEISFTPLLPSRMARQNAVFPMPLGLTTPMPVITARLSIDSDSIIDAGFMRLKLKVLTYYVRRAQGASKAIISSLAAGLMAFFTGVVVPITLWEKFSSHRNEPSADVPVVFFSLVF